MSALPPKADIAVRVGLNYQIPLIWLRLSQKVRPPRRRSLLSSGFWQFL